MSVAALKGARAVTPKLRQLIADLPTEDPAREDRRARRPSWMAAALVHLVLADRHRQDRNGGRGCATESVAQLAEVTGLSEQVVRRCLDALHEVGVWTRGRRGGPGRATERIPMFLPENSGPPEGAEFERNEAENSGPTGGAENADPLRENSGPIGSDSAPIGDNSAPPVGATPPTTTIDHQTRERGSAAQLVAQYADEVPSLIEGLNITYGEGAVRESIDAITASGARFRFPSDLVKAIETEVTGLGSFDLADYATGPAVPPMPRRDPGRFVEHPDGTVELREPS